MHSNGCIAVIRDENGNSLIEQNNTVKLPFGSEFEIFLRNRNGFRVGVTVKVDGSNPFLHDAFLILDAQSSYSLKGFENGKRFKFYNVESQEAIELGRSNKNIENGIVSITFYKENIVNEWKWLADLYDNKNEKKWVPFPDVDYPWPQKPRTKPVDPFCPQWYWDTHTMCEYTGKQDKIAGQTHYNPNADVDSQSAINSAHVFFNKLTSQADYVPAQFKTTCSTNTQGIIDESDNFHDQEYVSGNFSDSKQQIANITIKIIGENVVRAETTKDRCACVCGTIHKASTTDKFCKNCGAELAVFAVYYNNLDKMRQLKEIKDKYKLFATELLNQVNDANMNIEKYKSAINESLIKFLKNVKGE